jgi:tyrosine-protein phosphatase SIW14
MKVFVGFILFSFFAGFSQAQQLKGVPEFRQVTVGIYRGGRPKVQDMAILQRQQQIKTIISLENSDHAEIIRREREATEKLGMKFINVPLDVYETPADKDMAVLLRLLDDEALQPVFVHCLHGEDRTGLVIGLYRFKVQGWTADQAYREMLDQHFHPRYSALDKYFRQETGYNH